MQALQSLSRCSIVVLSRPALPHRHLAPAGLRAARKALCRAQQQQETQLQSPSDDDADLCDYNVAGAYCSIDEQGQRLSSRTLGEMEQEFLTALSSWYYEGKPMMTDEEFETLKDELLWNGSKVAVLDSKEQRFLEASMAYQRGKPILTDQQFDELKSQLKAQNSIVTAEGPRCSLRSKKMYSDATPDYLRMTALNIPAALVVLGLVFGLDDITGFEITQFIELPPPYGIVALWGLLLPAIFVVATSITNLVLKDGVILQGACPSCGTTNFTYFGDIFSVSGTGGQNVVECGNCKADLTVDAAKRIVVVAEPPEEKEKKIAAAAAKKAAAAQKKAAAAARKKEAGSDQA